MAINPLQIPQYAAPVQADFSSLAQLPQIYQQGQKRQLLAELGQSGNQDPRALIQAGLQTGDMTLANLGMHGLQQQQAQARQAAQDAYQRERAGVEDKFRAQQLGQTASYQNAQLELSRRAADRADDPTPKGFVKDDTVPGGYRPIGPNDPAYIAQVAEAQARAKAAAGGGEAGLSPIYGVDKDGKPVIMQMHPSGKAVRTQLPEDVSVSRDPIRIDRGTTIDLVDPVTRQLIRTIPKDVAGVETAKVVGEEAGKGQVALPQVLATSSQTLQAIEAVRKHPGRSWATGALGSVPGIPGTAQRGFIANLDQLKGKTFLEAFNALRGGGAITEAEGAKATNAMARLDRAQNDKDFESALDDLRDVVKSGMMRAQAKARGPTQAAPAAGGVVDYRTYFGQ